MKIIESSNYKKDLKKKIINKHMHAEETRIRSIKELILDSENLKLLMLNPLRNIYGISHKKEKLKEIYTARVNSKIRLYMKPIGEYPYNEIEITSIEFLKIDDTHYGEG